MTKNKKMAIYIIVAGVIILLFGLFLSINFYKKFPAGPPRHVREENISLISGWMTFGYVSHLYKIPKPELYKKFELSDADHRKSIRDVSFVKNIPEEVFVENVKEFVIEFTSHSKKPGKKELDD